MAAFNRTAALGLGAFLLAAGKPAGAQESELPTFATPAASSDAGALTAPPLPPPAPPRPPPAPPPPARWSRLGGWTGLVFNGLTSAFLGVELGLLATLAGTPEPDAEEPGHAGGWLFQAGVSGGYGRLGIPRCTLRALCGERGFGGLSLKFGRAKGVVNVRDGVVRAQLMLFGQADVALGRFELESAPLSAGLKTWELIVRGRLGVHFTSTASRQTPTGVTLLGALVLEGVPASLGTQGVALGASLGLGF